MGKEQKTSDFTKQIPQKPYKNIENTHLFTNWKIHEIILFLQICLIFSDSGFLGFGLTRSISILNLWKMSMNLMKMMNISFFVLTYHSVEIRSFFQHYRNFEKSIWTYILWVEIAANWFHIKIGRKMFKFPHCGPFRLDRCWSFFLNSISNGSFIGHLLVILLRFMFLQIS